MLGHTIIWRRRRRRKKRNDLSTPVLPPPCPPNLASMKTSAVLKRVTIPSKAFQGSDNAMVTSERRVGDEKQREERRESGKRLEERKRQ